MFDWDGLILYFLKYTILIRNAKDDEIQLGYEVATRERGIS